MAAKILIERKVKPNCLGDFLEISLELRALAMRQHGYISGETLGSTDVSGSHLVISTWRSLDEWKAWENNPERIAISERMGPLLEGSSVMRAFTDLWGSGV